MPTKYCKIENCKKKYYAKRYCHNHYIKKYRLIKYGIGNKRHKCMIKNCNLLINRKSKYCQRHKIRIKNNLPLDLSTNCYGGKRNFMWKGGISPYRNHYLMKKNRLFILIHHPKCEYCGKFATEIHHKDEDKTNHNLSNLMAICCKCHRCHHSKFYKKFGYTLRGITQKLGRSMSYWQRHQKEIKSYL